MLDPSSEKQASRVPSSAGPNFLDSLGLSERNKSSAERVTGDLSLALSRTWRAACQRDPDTIKALCQAMQSQLADIEQNPGTIKPSANIALAKAVDVLFAAGAADDEAKAALARVKDELPGLLLAIAPALMRAW